MLQAPVDLPTQTQFCELSQALSSNWYGIVGLYRSISVQDCEHRHAFMDIASHVAYHRVGTSLIRMLAFEKWGGTGLRNGIAALESEPILGSSAGRIDNYLCELGAQPGGSQGRPDTTAGSRPIGILGRPTSDSPRTASLVSKSPAPVPDAAHLSTFHPAWKSTIRARHRSVPGGSLNHARLWSGQFRSS